MIPTLLLTSVLSALPLNGQPADAIPSIVYKAWTGEVAIETQDGITAINLNSAGSLLGDFDPQHLDGDWDVIEPDTLFKLTPFGSFNSISWGKVAQPGLVQSVIAADLTADGAMSDKSELPPADLIYVAVPAWCKTDLYSPQSPEYRTWKWSYGFNSTQFTEGPGEENGYGKPYGFQIQTNRGRDLEWYRDMLMQTIPNDQFLWISLDIDLAETALTIPVRDLIRELAPHAEVWSGHHLGWDMPDRSSIVHDRDVLVTAYDVGTEDKMGSDYAYILAQALFYGRPLVAAPYPTANEDDYRDAIHIGQFARRGLGMPNAHEIFSDNRPDIMQIWQTATQRTPPVTVLIPWSRASYLSQKSLARVVWLAGFIPEVFDPQGYVPPEWDSRILQWSDLQQTIIDLELTNYGTLRDILPDLNHAERLPNHKEVVREMEIKIATALRDILLTRSLTPRDPGNQFPMTQDDNYTMWSNTVLDLAPNDGPLMNDNDPDGNPLIAIPAIEPTNGIAILDNDGTLRYTPNPNWSGSDSVSYRVYDGELHSNTSIITIVVNSRIPGDVDGDGDFTHLDLAIVRDIGKFRTGEPATWEEGDWNGDGVFDQWDLVLAFTYRG